MMKKNLKVPIIITVMIVCLIACGKHSAGTPNQNDIISNIETSTAYDYGIDYYEHIAKLTKEDLEVIVEMSQDYAKKNGISATSHEANLYCAELIKQFAAKNSETKQ